MEKQNKIRTNAVDILNENRQVEDSPVSLLEYFEREKENDPYFFNWLFPDAENINDFGDGMTEEQNKAFDLFEEEIKNTN